MRCCIISDNSFFLLGLQGSFYFTDDHLTVIHLDKLSNYDHNIDYDAIVIYVSNPIERCRSLNFLLCKGCASLRSRIFLKSNVYDSKYFLAKSMKSRRLIPGRVSSSLLYHFLRVSFISPRPWKRFSLKKKSIIHLLSEGHSVSVTAAILGISESSIYNLRKEIESDLGLRGNMATVNLFCRDVLKLAYPGNLVSKSEFGLTSEWSRYSDVTSLIKQ